MAAERSRRGTRLSTRLQPGLLRRGLGPALLEAAEQWAQAQGAGSLMGLIKTSNVPSMKMVTTLARETAGRLDYLVLELARFDGMAAPRTVQSNHFAPLFLERELFSPAPEGAYAGSWTATSRRGTA